MKMRKLISIIAAIAIFSTSVITANAAIELTENGTINTLIADSEYQTRTPKINVSSVDKLTDKATVKDLTNLIFSNNAGNPDTNDVYKITFSLNNLGELVTGYNAAGTAIVTSGVTAFQIALVADGTIKGTATNKAYITGGNLAVGQDATTKYYNTTWSAPDTSNPYPYFDEATAETYSVYSENAEMSFYIVVAIEKGTSAEFTFVDKADANASSVTYLSTGGVAQGIKVTPVADSFKLGEVAKTKYTVTFMNGEETVQSGEVEEGAVITAPTDPVKAGYTFDGWYDGETKFVAGTTASKTVTYTAKFTKDPVSVTKITISGVAETMTVGYTGTATATVEPADADIKTVTWTSSDEDVLTINATTGAYEALKAGTAEITATAADGSSVTATVNVTVNAPAPAEQKITVGPRFKGTTNKGFVWRVTVENFKNAGLSYKFTDEDTSKVRENDFNLGTLELSNFVFDVIMNTERANVKLEVK